MTAAGMLNAASMPAGTSIVPVAFCPRAAVAVPTVQLVPVCAAVTPSSTKTNAVADINSFITPPFCLWVKRIVGVKEQRHNRCLELSFDRRYSFNKLQREISKLKDTANSELVSDRRGDVRFAGSN